ncbi:MAG: hypothetical protein V1816_26210 [Pseudomonadota bacterium]
MFKQLIKKIKPTKPRAIDESLEVEDFLSIARPLEELFDTMVSGIFSRHCLHLLNQEIAYIVPAVWGAAKEGELSPEQKEIHREVIPMIRQAFALLGLRNLNPAQEFALGYVLRSLIVTKMIYMIEASKRRQAEENVGITAHDGLLDMEPMGRA